MTATKKGIVLMNLGSPDSTSVKDVRRYLNEFLMDERVIDMSYLSRLLLVRGIIVPFRAPKSAHAYSTIWTKEGSPLMVLSKQLQVALQQQVTEPVALAMRYGAPAPWTAYDELLEKAPDLEEVVLVPLYPHYALSSYETAVEYAKDAHKKGKYSFKLTIIPPFYDNTLYLDSLADSIRPYLQQEYDHIVFSYHGIPERHVQKTDVTGKHCLKVDNCCEVTSEAHKYCYRHQVLDTTKKWWRCCRSPQVNTAMHFQSRLGRDEWLKPYTAKRLTEFPSEGVKKLLIACPAFVSDCLETLEEIAIQGRDSFIESGGESLTLIPCLNVHPMWVKAIASWVNEK